MFAVATVYIRFHMPSLSWLQTSVESCLPPIMRFIVIKNNKSPITLYKEWNGNRKSLRKH